MFEGAMTGKPHEITAM